jgi:hypothetical protein
MNIIMTPKLVDYLSSINEQSVTVDIIKKRSNCCAVGTPKAIKGVPFTEKVDLYNVYSLGDYTFYIDKEAPIINDSLTFDYNSMFMLKMIEVHGIDFTRML